jgi:hypothetical protein
MGNKKNMENQINSIGKQRKIINFMIGFLGPVATICLILWLPKVDFNNIYQAGAVVVGLLVAGVFAVLAEKTTVTGKNGEFLYKNKYFKNGLVFFGIVSMSAVLLFVFYCMMVPDTAWFWKSK